VLRELEDPGIWNDPERAQELGRERTRLEGVVGTLDRLKSGISEAGELLELAEAESDAGMVGSVQQDVGRLEADIARLEFQRMFPGEMDSHNCFLDIQAGAGGTEAQDWAQMLMRMYLRWADQHGFRTEVTDISEGEVAGIKSCSIRFEGEYAYGWLRTETGVHRLVRKSPFDSNARRHTSFASVFVSPEVDDDISIEVNPADIEMDVYRSSGAGGQHVNKTESAVRLRHLPSGIVVACQSERSQHKNRSTAMKMLKAKLYELEVNKRNAAAKVLEDSKSDVSWGNQIRSYVLIADAAQNGMAGDYQSVGDGVLLVATILGWSFALDWLANRFPDGIGRLVEPPPVALVRDGRILRRNLRREMLTEDELMARLRLQGVDDVGAVRWAAIESNGEISVLKAGDQPDAKRSQGGGR
jgi:peptide chain release factor 2